MCRVIDTRARTRAGARIERQHFAGAKKNLSRNTYAALDACCAHVRTQDKGRGRQLVKMLDMCTYELPPSSWGKHEKQRALPTVTPALKVAVKQEEEERCRCKILQAKKEF